MANVLLATGNGTTSVDGDAAIFSRLSVDLGHVVTVVSTTNILTNVAGKDLVVVTASGNSGSVNNLSGINIPVWISESFNWDDQGWATTPGFFNNGLYIRITRNHHPITKNLPLGLYRLYNSQPGTSYLLGNIDNSDAACLAVEPDQGNFNKAFLATYDVGDRLTNGSNANYRICLFGVWDGGAAQFTSIGWELFDRSIGWLLGTLSDVSNLEEVGITPSSSMTGSYSVTDYWTANDNVNISGKTCFIVFNINDNTTRQDIWSNSSAGSGWIIGTDPDSSFLYGEIYQRVRITFPGGDGDIIFESQRLNLGRNVIGVSFNAGTLSVSVNGQLPSSVITTTYVAPNSSTHYFGRSNTVNYGTSISLIGAAVLDVAITDSNQFRYFTDRCVHDLTYGINSDIVQHTSLRWHINFNDWDGVSSTLLDDNNGTIPCTLTLNGNLTKTPLPSLTVYSYGQNSLHDTISPEYQLSHYHHDAWSSLKIITNSQSVYWTGCLLSPKPHLPIYECGLDVNGLYFDNVYCLSQDDNNDIVEVGFVGLNSSEKTIDLYPGIHNAFSTSVHGGLYHVGQIRLETGSTNSIIMPSPPENRLVIIGDSIVAGVAAASAAEHSFSLGLKRNYIGWNTTIDAWRSRALADVPIPTMVSDTITRLNGTERNIILLQLSTNDYGDGLLASSFQTNLETFCDSINVQNNQVDIYILTALSRNVETANASGSTLEDFRVAAETVANSRNWVYIIDGPSSMNILNLNADGLHPNNIGMDEIEAALLFGLPSVQIINNFSNIRKFYSEYSLDFDGTDDRVSLGNPTELDIERTDAFSISAWVKTSTTASTQSILSKKQDSGGLYGFIFAINAGGGLVMTFTSTASNPNRDLTVTSTAVLETDRWYHVVMTYDGSSTTGGIGLYVDGEISPNVIVNAGPLLGSIQISQGASIGSRHDTTNNISFNGRIDEVAVYNKELSLSEVSEIYNYGQPNDLTLNGPTANLIGYWPLGQHNFPTVPDLSPSSNDGTMINMTTNDIVIDAPRPREVIRSMLFNQLSSKYINVGIDVPELNFSWTQSFSVCIWAKCRKDDVNFPERNFCVININSSYRGWALIGTTFRLARGGTQMRVSSPLANDVRLEGEWMFVCATYDGSQDANGIKIYANGVEYPTVIEDNSLAVDITDLGKRLWIMGDYSDNRQFNDAACQVSAWSKELTSAEITDLYNNGRGRDARTIGASSDLVGYWPMDDVDSFPTVPDLSVSANNATAVNMTVDDIRFDAPGLDFSFQSVSDRSIEFNGGRVEIGNVLNFTNTDSFSVGVWFKTDGTDTGALVSKMDTGGTDAGWLLSTESGGVLRFIARSGASNEIRIDTQKNFSDEVWHHFVVTYDGSGAASGVFIYVDGINVPVTIGQDNLNGTIASSAILSFGSKVNAAAATTLEYGGFIDDIVIYNKVLLEIEVRTLYGTRSPTNALELLPIANLVGYWRMGDGIIFPIIPDLSSNGNDGEMLPGLHHQRIINDRPPNAASNQFANGTNGILTAPSNPFNFGKNDSFSISCWFRTTSGVNQYPPIIRHTDDGSGGFGYIRGYILGVEGFSSWTPGSLYLILAHNNSANTEIQVNTTIAYNDGVWRHLVVTYNGSGLSTGVRFYINGSLAGIVSRRNALGANDFQTSGEQPLFIENATNPNTGAEGAVCQIAIYSKELTAAEVTTIYGAGTLPDLSVTGPTANLEGYWPIVDTDVPNLPVVADASVNNRDVIAQNIMSSIVNDSPKPLTSFKSIEFDGTNDYISIGNISEFSFTRTSVFSLSVWTKTPSGSAAVQAILGKQLGSGNFTGWIFAYQTSGVIFLLTSTPTNEINISSGPLGIDDGNWHHHCLTYDGSSRAVGVRYYLDGEEKSISIVEDTLTGTTTNTIGLAIGARNSSAQSPIYNDGNIDNVVIYNRVLSPSEVFLLGGQREPLDHGAIGPVDALIGWWRMGDGDTFPTVNDNAVAYDNDGTMTNMVAGNIIEDVASPNYYSMRGIDDLGPGYEYWIANERNPDFDASEAPGAIVPGSAVVTASWSTKPTRYLMRALADPGPGYVTWIANNFPDLDGSEAEQPIQLSTIVFIKLA